MHEPAKAPLDRMRHDRAMKHESMVYQFHSIWFVLDIRAFTVLEGQWQYRDSAATTAHAAHAAHTSSSSSHTVP